LCPFFKVLHCHSYIFSPDCARDGIIHLATIFAWSGTHCIVFEYGINYAGYIDKTWSSLSAYHADIQGSGDWASLILHISTRWRWVISLCLSHFISWEKASGTHWMKLSGHLSQCRCFLKKRKSLLGIEPIEFIPPPGKNGWREFVEIFYKDTPSGRIRRSRTHTEMEGPNQS
jgi:hypothetical protein